MNRLSYRVAGDANISRSLERNAELQIQLDKPAYSGGDTIQVSIRAPYVGSGLITVERDRVYQYQWFKSTTTSTVQNIRLPKDFEGNGYVGVQFVRDPASDELFMSPLSYGVASFNADLSARTQPLTLTTPREIKPGANLVILVKPRQASRVAVLAVDEGILQVARYKDPDPLGYFFQKRMLEVRSSQILDLILPDFKRFLALASAGGDADGGFSRHLNPFNKKHKPPVAYWSGLIDVGPAGKELHYTVPDFFNGKIRIVAIAANNLQVGVAESSTEVKGDFILTPNLPETAAPGDEFTVSVGVFNNTTGKSGPVQLEAQIGSQFTGLSATRVELQIPDKKEATGEFRFKTNSALGAASIKFVARRGNSIVQIEESIGVRPAAAYRTQLTLGKLDATTTPVALTRDLFDEQRKVEAAISWLPLVWAQGLSAYLENYPYLCTEQISSQGMSLMLLKSRPEFGTLKGNQTLENVISILRTRQNDEGGLGLWSSSPQTAEFPTIYATHLLLDAKDRREQIPTEMLSTLNDWLSRFAATPAPSLSDARLRSYAVYLLARQGIKPTAALANVEQELSHRYGTTWQSDLAAAYIASTYQLMQHKDEADRLVKNVAWSPQKRDWSDDVYYDPVIHDAQLLYLLAKHFPSRIAAAPPVALETIAKASKDGNLNSLSAAYSLLSLDAYARSAAANGKLGITEIEKDGKERNLALTGGSMPKVGISQSAGKVQFDKQGASLAFFVLAESGFDRNAPTTASSQGIEVFREFIDTKGTVVTQVKVGDEFLVRLRLRSTQRERIPQIAVVDLLPAGVEPVVELRPPSDTSTPGTDPALAQRSASVASLPIGVVDKSDWRPAHVDVRSDRVVLYGAATRDAGTFVYRVRATNAGIFQVPPAFAEGMYDRRVSGWTGKTTLEIVKP